MKQKYQGNIPGILLSPGDNIALATTSSGKRGQMLCVSGKDKVKLLQFVPLGHKIAILKIKAGQAVLKCGQIIGVASHDIAAGKHVHNHNIVFTSMPAGTDKCLPQGSIDLSGLPETFQGYLRKDGRAGTRNYVVVVSTVNCSAGVVRAVAREFEGLHFRKDMVRVVPVVHSGGCAQSANGYPIEILNRALAGWINHPNVVGAVVIGLGCELVRLETIFPSVKERPNIPISFFDIQKSGGVAESIQKGIVLTKRIISSLSPMKRKELPLSFLTLAAKCGGSDAFSVITANPALGAASDLLISAGGTAAMGEIPECWGARENLLNRCRLRSDRERLRKIYSWWEHYSGKHGVSINDNISPGNIEGGISTILEKSVGAAVKGGSSCITQVADFAERISRKGLVVMNTPGFDPVAMTGLVAGGCNIAAFTTGRGSVYGCSITPTLKIATNSKVFQEMKGDMDFDAGPILKGEDVQAAGRRLFRLILAVAGGQETKSETQGLGGEEFVPWSAGETL